MTQAFQEVVRSRWPAAHPNAIQLYSFPTPNGIKVSVMLEETGLEYEAQRVTLSAADVGSSEFERLNPNRKIPVILDPNGPDGAPITVFESGAILLYLADKTGQFCGDTARDRARVTQWLMFQMSGLGPMLGQVGYYVKFAGSEIEDPRPREKYAIEAKRLLAVLNTELANRDWIAGDYSIADMAIAPWLRALDYYGTKDIVGWDDHKYAVAYLDRFMQRPAAQAAVNIPPREG